jgi:hypothetical protein
MESRNQFLGSLKGLHIIRAQVADLCTGKIVGYVCTHVHGRIGERSGSAGGGGGEGGGRGESRAGPVKTDQREREYTPTCLPARTGPKLVRPARERGGGGGGG